MWQVCLELNVSSLFAVGADPGDPHLRVDSVPQGPKQGSYLRNRPVMRLRRPAMSVARESMVRILVMEKFVYYKTVEVFFLSSEGSREEGVHGC